MTTPETPEELLIRRQKVLRSVARPDLADALSQEAVVGRRGRWVWNRPWSEPFGPRAHPERCDEWPGKHPEHGLKVDMGRESREVGGRESREVGRDGRLTLLCWLQAIQTVAVVGGAYLFFRWARIACWLTGCA